MEESGEEEEAHALKTRKYRKYNRMKNAAYLFGILCILAGLLLFVRNLGEDREAGIEASDSLQVLADELREEEKGTQQPFCVDGGRNIPGTGKETQQAVLSFYKDMEMPAKRVDRGAPPKASGVRYVFLPEYQGCACTFLRLCLRRQSHSACAQLSEPLREASPLADGG